MKFITFLPTAKNIKDKMNENRYYSTIKLYTNKVATKEEKKKQIQNQCHGHHAYDTIYIRTMLHLLLTLLNVKNGHNVLLGRIQTLNGCYV